MTLINYDGLRFETPVAARRPGAFRRYGKRILAFGVSLTLANMAVTTGVRELEQTEAKYRNRIKAKQPVQTAEDIARQKAVDSIFGTVKPHEKPPQPLSKVIGSMAIHIRKDSQGNDVYAYIPNPAIVDMPDGTQRAIGEPLPDSRITVMDGYILCGPTPEPELVEVSPLGYGYNGFGDSRIGSLRTSRERPEGCNYEYAPPPRLPQ